jgi:hypothetical protein
MATPYKMNVGAASLLLPNHDMLSALSKELVPVAPHRCQIYMGYNPARLR